jgi:drug/metabolite transporter (DMT)-like permease
MKEVTDKQFANFDKFAVCMIVSWYTSNIGVLLLNKYLLSLWGFKYPIFLTMLHMLSCLILSIVVRLTGLVPRQHIRSRRHLFKVCVLSLVFVVSVVGGNISLRFIPVSFNQAIGATTPLFTALVSSSQIYLMTCTDFYVCSSFLCAY